MATPALPVIIIPDACLTDAGLAGDRRGAMRARLVASARLVARA